MTVVKNWRLEHIQLFFTKLFPLLFTKIRKRTAPCPLTGNFFILQQVLLLLGLVLCVVTTLVKQIYEEHGSGGKHSLVHWWSCVLRQTGLLWKGDWRQQPRMGTAVASLLHSDPRACVELCSLWGLLVNSWSCSQTCLYQHNGKSSASATGIRCHVENATHTLLITTP